MMLLETISVLLLEILQVLDDFVLLFIYHLLIARSVTISVVPLASETLLALVNQSLLVVGGDQGVLRLSPLRSEVLPVFLEGLFETGAFPGLPLNENNLFVRSF